MKKLNGNITISRTNRDEVVISVRDELSRHKFVEVSLTFEQFGQILTGLSHVDCQFEVHGLEEIGKKKVMENRSVLYTGKDNYNPAGMETWIDENCQGRYLIMQISDPVNCEENIVVRLRKRATIRRQISTRKSVQEGKPDRLADLLEEAASKIERLQDENLERAGRLIKWGLRSQEWTREKQEYLTKIAKLEDEITGLYETMAGEDL